MAMACCWRECRCSAGFTKCPSPFSSAGATSGNPCHSFLPASANRASRSAGACWTASNWRHDKAPPGPLLALGTQALFESQHRLLGEERGPGTLRSARLFSGW